LSKLSILYKQGAAQAASAYKLKEKRKNAFFKNWILYLLLLPSVGSMILFIYYPTLNAIYHSFFDWHPGFESRFIGFDNYIRAFTDTIFLKGFGYVGLLVLFGVTLAFAVPFIVAEMLMSIKRTKIQSLFKSLLILPLAFPSIVTILLWGFLFDPNQGGINKLLGLLHLSNSINWLGTERLAIFSIMLIGFPWVASLPFLVYLAGLQSIPDEIRQSSLIDGCNVFQRILYIDIPSVLSQTRMLTILAVVGWIQNIVPIMLLTRGGPSYGTMVPGLWTYFSAFTNGEWGYAAALSTILFFIMIIISFFSWKLMRTE